ncbi:MAG: hypothetical protein NVSMB24_34380 [Mucilaginibacter sp.]
MLGKLTNNQVEDLLKNQPFGRIGMHANGVTYVVPVNYYYDGTAIYAHSGNGMKIDMMRRNPEVCFEVDMVQNIFNWKCVIAWGKFEEITHLREKESVMQKLADKIMFTT